MSCIVIAESAGVTEWRAPGIYCLVEPPSSGSSPELAAADVLEVGDAVYSLMLPGSSSIARVSEVTRPLTLYLLSLSRLPSKNSRARNVHRDMFEKAACTLRFHL